MIGVLFFVNAIVAIIILFTTSMLQNHFTKIERSLNIYTDTKAYKPEGEVRFINKLISRYKTLSQQKNSSIDIETMILKAFYEERIGRFSYIKVQAIALQGKIMMWIILVLQIAFEILGKNPGQSIGHFIYIVASTFLCMLTTLISVIKSIADQREQLLIKLQDYIINAYPAEISWQSKQKNIKDLLHKIEKLENELQNYQTQKQQKEVLKQEKEVLSKQVDKKLKEEDIKNLLEKFNLNI